jgi:hypothetical protein
MLRCKDANGEIIYTNWKYIKSAWLPAITICTDGLYPKFIETPKMVINLQLSSVSENVSITWNPDSRYYTEVQIKQDDGEWVTYTVPKGIGEL